MSVYYVTVRGKQYTVEVPDPHARPVRAIVDGEVVEVNVASVAVPVAAPVAAPAPAAKPAPVPDAPQGAGEEVKSPLPGTVVSIAVSVGDQVTHGQELCVLEAMKMNNPIRASKAGVIQKVFVTVGQQVQHGAPLVTIGN